MGERITRRDFLKLVFLGATAVALGGDAGRIFIDPVFRIDFEGHDELNFDLASKLLLRFDKVLDSLPQPIFDNTIEGLKQYADEIIPQFDLERIVPYSRWPNIIQFKIQKDGAYILGTSDCEFEANLNARMGNNLSTWGKREELFSFVHELAHIQQGRQRCWDTSTELIENSAQIAAMEVSSGLAIQGNYQYFWAAVNELRRMTLRSAEVLAFKEKRMDEFKKLRHKVSPGALAAAYDEKYDRYWEGQYPDKYVVYEMYGLTPLSMIIHAIRNNGNMIDNLAFPGKSKYYGSHAQPKSDSSIKLDDTAYLIANLEGMARDFSS